MADTFQLEVATPERLLVDEQVNEAELPGQDGYMGVLAGHAPLLSALGAGVLTFQSGGEHVLAIDGGFVEVFNNHVRVLADHAEFGRDIQGESARRQLDEALQAIKTANQQPDSDAALAAVKKAQARADAAEKAGGKAP
jgi:F-type H+-transporting ATPase subunit epsilon